MGAKEKNSLQIASSNDVLTSSQCASQLEQLKQKPKLHLAEAKKCLTENEGLNKSVVGKALSLQIEALVGDRKAWNKYFSSVDDAVWVLTNVDWNSLNPRIIARAIYFLDVDFQTSPLFHSPRILDIRKQLQFDARWMDEFLKMYPHGVKPHMLAASFTLKPFILSGDCDAIDYGLMNPLLISEYPAAFAIAVDRSGCVSTMASKNPRSDNNSTTQPIKPAVSSADLIAAQKKALQLEEELAALKAQQQKQQQTISQDTELPLIDIASANEFGKQGIIKGWARDNTGIAEVTVDGTVVPVNSNGSFEYSTFVPSGGLSVVVQATDLAGLTSTTSVALNRSATVETAAIKFDRLNPLGKQAAPNKNALALIIGIDSYKNAEPAKYADSDALMFRDYASEKLGIPEGRIKTLVNGDATIAEILLSIRKWLRRSTNQDKTDIYVFFAGHGLAAPEGKAYLIPFDGRPELEVLDKTALLQSEFFEEIAAAKPRSVTVFLDACYTGKTRTGKMLLAQANYRPIVPVALDDGLPENFTLMTASSGSEFSGPLEEAKHGMFSYFLMKGMEGEADANQDNRITAGELHAYVELHVDQQSSGNQTPELQGDADRVLVQFQ